MEPIKYRRPRWTPLAVFCLILTWNDRIQSFWELTYKFPGGLKTGIALAVLSLLLTLNGRTQSFWELTYEFPGGPKTGIALAKDSCLFVGLLTGIIRSCDEGYSFENALQSTSIATVFAGRSAKVFAGGAGRIYASNNLGETWDSVSLPTVYPVLQIIDTPNGGLFAITGADIGLGGDGVFYSADNGRTWQRIDAGLGANILGMRHSQYFVEKSNGRLFMVQYLDERIYKLKADRPTPVKTPARPSFPLKIYPNPVAPGQPFYIDKPSGLPNYQIDIFDAAGRRHGAIQGDDMRTPVNAPATPGIYFIRVDTGNKGRTLQLIVQ